MKSNSIETHTIKVTKELLASFNSARTRYGIALEEKKREKTESKRGMKRKQIDGDIADVTAKRLSYCKPLKNCQKMQISWQRKPKRKKILIY